MSHVNRSVWFLTLLALATLTTEAPAAPLPREILGGELIVKDALEALEAPVGRIQYLVEEDLAHAFPHYLFFVVRYTPTLAASLPKPLKHVTVVAVDPEGRAHFLGGNTELVEVFKAGFYPPRKGERCKLAVRAALLLARAEHPGYKLTIAEDEIKITTEPRGIKQAVGKLVVQDGGGDITATLTLDACCDPTRIVMAVNLKEVKVVETKVTTAEITAAEKLVKARVEEAHLAVEAVKILEDPVLKRATPGYIFFTVPVADADKDDPKRMHADVMVVDPSGKVIDLFGKGGKFIDWFGSTLALGKEDPLTRDSVAVVRRLFMAVHPGFEFGTPEDPEIKAEDDGVRRVFIRIPATGRSGGKWLLQVSFTIGKRGRIVAYGVFFRPVKG
jgi:hypothetical protein